MAAPKMKMYTVPETGGWQRWAGMGELTSLDLHGLQKQHFAIPKGCIFIFFLMPHYNMTVLSHI